MSAPTLEDLRARIDALKKANMMNMKPLAEAALESFMQYLAAQDARFQRLEGERHGNNEKTGNEKTVHPCKGCPGLEGVCCGEHCGRFNKRQSFEGKTA